jgi:hypothetical protein
MSDIDWYIEGDQFSSCNCSYACPCQFEALPNEGHCRGFEVVHIDQGHFADVRLAGLNVAVLYAWPGAVFQGGGELQAIIDERADAGQEHRVRIDIPNGIEFEIAEIGSATSTATAAIRLDLADTYGQFNRLRHCGKGVVHDKG